MRMKLGVVWQQWALEIAVVTTMEESGEARSYSGYGGQVGEEEGRPRTGPPGPAESR